MKAKGFTLMELMVIFTLIIVAAGMGIPAWQHHLIDRRKAITPDGIYHRDGNCLHWQDSRMQANYHCWKGDQHVKQSNVSWS